MIEAGDISVVLLAAGRSRRFGSDDKLLAPVAGVPLAFHAAMRIAELAPGRRIAVCPDADGVLAQRLIALGFEIVVNADAAAGLSRSLACGIAVAARGTEAAALVVLADMPFVTAEHLRTLLARFDPSAAPVVASTDGRTAMPPALFGRSLFGALQAGAGDRGGKALLEGATLVTAPPGELADIDLPGDIGQR
ncbi:nucleotidyltransferase family protein [Sphingopyxis sp.]|uniref:nucleotidyltransferase family protein n=1 Tax=Sphingopyxis sp. TaxID=1908224 RepID=UPI002ED8B545